MMHPFRESLWEIEEKRDVGDELPEELKLVDMVDAALKEQRWRELSGVGLNPI